MSKSKMKKISVYGLRPGRESRRGEVSLRILIFFRLNYEDICLRVAVTSSDDSFFEHCARWVRRDRQLALVGCGAVSGLVQKSHAKEIHVEYCRRLVGSHQHQLFFIALLIED